MKQSEETTKNEQVRTTNTKQVIKTKNLADDVVILKKPNVDISTKSQLVSTVAKKLADIIRDKQTMFYRSDIKKVVELVEVTTILHNGNATETSIELAEVSDKRFISYIETYINPGSYIKDANTGSVVFNLQSLSPVISSIILHSSEFINNILVIDRIISAPLPILYKNKLTFPVKGYDERFCTWLVKDSPEIDETMTLDEAKSVLEDVYGEFCFAAKQDYVNAIAGLLTPFLRGLYPERSTRTPIFFYRGNQPNVGKDTCAVITGITIENTEAEDLPISDGSEFHKKITSAFLSKRKRMHFANCKGPIKNKDFENLSTSHKWTDRILGYSNDSSFDNNLDLSMSGNTGVSYSADISTRLSVIYLKYDDFDTNARTFKRTNLRAFVKQNRARILSALYSFVKNWFDNGMKNGTGKHRFQQWAEICGGILEEAGYGSPCKNSADYFTEDADKDAKDIQEFFEIMFDNFPEKELSMVELQQIIREDKNMPFQTDNLLATSTTSKHLTEMIKRYANMIISGIKLVVSNQDRQQKYRTYKFTKLDKIDSNFNMADLRNEHE